MTAIRSQPKLTQDQFKRIRDLLYEHARIDLRQGKESLVEARLSKRLRPLGLADYEAYIGYLEKDRGGKELAVMVDSLTTNKTSFFREAQHFDFFTATILPALAGGARPARFWCAGCSSGEEPYTLSMLLRETWADADRRDPRILATDISFTVLEKARRGVYLDDQLEEVPQKLRRKYFRPHPGGAPGEYGVVPPVRGLVHFAGLNLMADWPMRGPFDAIFCRNVMIYFDRPTQERLVCRFHELVAPGGYFFISHSESLTGLQHPFEYVQPAVYRRTPT